jgi:hypothetical protein
MLAVVRSIQLENRAVKMTGIEQRGYTTRETSNKTREEMDNKLKKSGTSLNKSNLN